MRACACVRVCGDVEGKTGRSEQSSGEGRIQREASREEQEMAKESRRNEECWNQQCREKQQFKNVLCKSEQCGGWEARRERDKYLLFQTPARDTLDTVEETFQ